MQQTRNTCPIRFTFRKERKKSIKKEREEELRRGVVVRLTPTLVWNLNTTVHSLLGRLCCPNGHAASVGWVLWLFACLTPRPFPTGGLRDVLIKTAEADGRLRAFMKSFCRPRSQWRRGESGPPGALRPCSKLLGRLQGDGRTSETLNIHPPPPPPPPRVCPTLVLPPL